MSDEEQDSEKFMSSSKLSAAVPAFVPRIAYSGLTSPNNLVINSNLSPLVPEFKPSVCFTSPDLPPDHKPVHVHNLQYHVKQENIESQQDAPLQAYHSSYSQSKKITVKTEGNDEGLNTAENVTDSSGNTNTKKKKGRRKKKEPASDSTRQQGHEELNTEGFTEGQQHADSVGTKHEKRTSSKANEISMLQKNYPTLHSSWNRSTEDTEDGKINVGVTDFESFSSSDEQCIKKQCTTPNFTVSYSDKVKSLAASKNSSTASRHLVAEKSWVKDFTPDSSSMKDTQRSELHAGKSMLANNLHVSRGENKEAKGGRRGDGLKKRPDSTWNEQEESEYYKLRNGEPLKSQARHVEQIPRAGKQMGRNDSFKKMTCDDDDNWRLKRINSNVVDSTRTETLKKSNIKNLNTESLKKRTYHEEVHLDVDSKKFDKGVKHEKSVGHIAVDELFKSSKKQLQNLSELGSGSSEKECTRLHSSNVNSDFQSGSRRTIQAATNTMSVAPSNSTILEGEFPDLRESVKIKRRSSVDKRTIDHKEMISSPKPSAPMSYSAVLRSIPQPKRVTVSPAWENEHPTKHGGLLKVPPQATAGGVENEAGTKQKKKKKKKKKTTKEAGDKTQENSSPRRTEKPIQFDLGVMLQTISNCSPERKQSGRRNVIAATGLLPSQLSPAAPVEDSVKNIQLHKKDDNKAPHNTLDSTAPVVKRGKERENPARKKPSALKKIILKEREEKKKARETGESGEIGETDDKDDEICQDEENSTCEPEVENIVHQEVPSPLEADDTAYPEPSSPTDREIAAEIHSRKFREYCFQVPNKEVDNVATELLKELVRFQDRQFHKDPVKAKAKRRFVLGLREVSKHLKLRKLKCVIISSNVERIKSAGGLDDTLDGIINSCQEHQIPVVFALKRQLLGKVLLKKVPVSIVGIFNYDGAQEQFKTLIELTQKTRQAYSEKWQEIRQKLELQQKEITDTLVPTTEMDKMLSADGEEASKLPYITGEDADIKNHNAEVTESSDDDNDDDDDADDDHYDIEEEEENSNDQHNEKEDVIIENDLEIQDL